MRCPPAVARSGGSLRHLTVYATQGRGASEDRSTKEKLTTLSSGSVRSPQTRCGRPHIDIASWSAKTRNDPKYVTQER